MLDAGLSIAATPGGLQFLAESIDPSGLPARERSLTER
jgi:hypothetical protein